MLILGLLLAGIGLIVIFAIGPARAHILNNLNGSSIPDNYFFIRQLISLAIGLFAFFLAYKLPFNFWRKIARPILIFGLVLCFILATAGLFGWGIADCTNGACRWLNIGGQTFQPAEILKLGLILYLAEILGSRTRDQINSRETLLPLFITIALSLFFVGFAQRDLGTAMTIVVLMLSCLIASGLKTKILLAVCGVMVAFGALSIVAMPHRMERLATWTSSGENTERADSEDYHAQQAQTAIGSGGLFGVGIGSSRSAMGYLPESINDSVFAVMGEIFGFFGLLVLLAVFFIFLYRILKTASLLGDSTKRIFVAGFFGWILAHILINAASMTGIIPLTGVTLPFLSFGGTSLILMLATFGIVYKRSTETSRN